MGLLNKLAKKFSSQTSVAVKGDADSNAPVVCDGEAGAGNSVEERVDYSCPTLKDVSVKGGAAIGVYSWPIGHRGRAFWRRRRWP